MRGDIRDTGGLVHLFPRRGGLAALRGRSLERLLRSDLKHAALVEVVNLVLANRIHNRSAVRTAGSTP